MNEIVRNRKIDILKFQLQYNCDHLSVMLFQIMKTLNRVLYGTGVFKIYKHIIFLLTVFLIIHTHTHTHIYIYIYIR